MTSNYQSRQLLLKILGFFYFLCAAIPVLVQAQTSQLLSVSPTLFEMSAVPGQTWTSALKVVNPNPYELTVYVTAVNFAPRGEGGDGTLLPVLETEAEGVTLAEWVVVDSSPITINREGTVEVPFTVQVPEAAAPGGHFAALLVSTKPAASAGGATELKTAQVVTSLFFLRVAGDVTEAGTVREFRTERSFYGSPRADFSLRFENTGNVHLRPQGDITITNMWGQERGIIPINRQSHFGNVLPESIRKFSFSWEGEWSLSDVGRHKAIVTLAYGQDARQFVTSTAYFWFVPLMPVLITVGSLITLIVLLVWLVRLYVRRLLEGAGFGGTVRQPYVRRAHRRGDLALTSRATPVSVSAEPKPVIGNSHFLLRAPSDLYSKLQFLCTETLALLQHATTTTTRATLRQLLRRYWRVMLGVAVALLLIVGVILFVRAALTPLRSYTVTYEEAAGGPTVSSDEIMYEASRDDNSIPPLPQVAEGETSIVVDIVNVSGVAGAAATVALVLEAQGYAIGDVTTDLAQAQGRTVIVYEGDTGDAAFALSQQLNNALLSAYNDGETSGAPITIYLGADIAARE